MSMEPSEGAVPLAFDVWANLSARMLNLDPLARLAVLDEHGLSEDDWMDNDEQQCVALAQDVAQGRMDRAESYAGKCAAELERRRLLQANAPAPAEGSPPDLPSAPEAAMKIGAPVDAAREAVPTFLQPQQVPARPLAGPPAELVATAGVFELPSALRGGALPFQKSPAQSPFASPSTAKPARTPDGAGETLPLTRTVSLAGTLPFGTADEPASAAAFPRMPLHLYAMFCAELTLFPERASDVQGKYSVRSDAARSALDQDWQARFDAHPETRAEWQTLVTQNMEALRRRGRA